MRSQPDSPLLVVIQAKATQFDGPFFRYLSTESSFRLSVYFTSGSDAIKPFDPELSFCPDWNEDVVSGYPFQVYPPGWSERIRTSLKLVRLRPNLIIMSGWRSFDNLFVLLMACLTGTPVGVRADNAEMTHAGGRVKMRFRHFLRNRLLGLFTTGHPVGSLAGAYLAEGGIHPDRLFPFPYLVDQSFLTHRYNSAVVLRDALRAHYGIGPNDFVVLGVMKFVDREDPITLVRSFLLLSQQLTGVRLILVGEGPLRDQIERLLEEEGLSDAVLPGYVPYESLPDFFAMSDILVHTARHEPWGVTVNEALVCGLPVLAADTVGSATDLIEAGINGFIFPCGDIEALASIMKRIRCEGSLLTSLKNRCREPEGLSRFTYASTCENLTRALRLASGG